MGFFDIFRPLNTGKKIAELEMALIGKHVFTNLANETEKEQVIDQVNYRLREGGIPDGNIDDLNNKVKYLFIALALRELGLDHGLLKDFHFIDIRNPFIIEYYDDELWKTASEVLQKKHGIKIKGHDPKSILIVDHDKLLVECMVDYLNKSFAEVEIETAINGEDAYKKVRRQFFDVIVTDIVMPGMDGIEFCEKAINEFPDIKDRIIFLTATPVEAHWNFIIKNNFKNLRKPCRLDDIKKGIAEVL